MNHNNFAFWHHSQNELLEKLRSSESGLLEKEARVRLKRIGKNRLSQRSEHTLFGLFISQFKSPLILLLLAAAILSVSLKDRTDALIIFLIIAISGTLSFFQEKGAVQAVAKLLELVRIHTKVLREGKSYELFVEQIVPGDLVILSAGDVVPADCLILSSKDCFVDEAALTGETFHVEKQEGILPSETPLSKRTNCLWMGTHVISGIVKALVIQTGRQTEFGKVSERLKFRPPETAFENGVRHFGYLLMEVTLLLVIAIFAFNIYLHRPFLESFLFALALAVGLTPQLLPAIISINLSHGARRMAKDKVVVKRLSSIENFGSMDVLCADKTGTLTLGVIELEGALDIEGTSSDEVFKLAYLNAFFQTGYTNPIDQAILHKQTLEISHWKKRDEIPYDFVRKRISIVAQEEQNPILITKGAFEEILSVCTQAKTKAGGLVPINEIKQQLQERFAAYSQKGFRVLGLCTKPLEKQQIKSQDEEQMHFAGFLLFFDPPKPGVKEIIWQLHQTGVRLKIITGDHHLCAAHLAAQVGLSEDQILTGSQMRKISDTALIKKVEMIDLFAEIEPNQKERIILALRKAGHIVGFLGDGVNDATALHTADVGISVDTAVDVAKEIADIVLMKKDLKVLLHGVQEGRKTFANTLKYIFMATSANFGNMFSMAGVSVLIPFLPLLPKQILLMNLLTDFPEMTIATDRVDADVLERPVRWDLKFIKRFMVVFGLISSIFDWITFVVLLYVLKAPQGQFRTGWFLESIASAALIVLVIRTRKPFFQSRPSPYLIYSVIGSILIAIALPYTPLAPLFGLEPIPLGFYYVIAAILAFYVLLVEVAKKAFYNYESWKDKIHFKKKKRTQYT
ncbi:MAG: magnesium-translocating P-type ATPase [Rhabdochlamydiaceae bacterium]|nr:magnesium-translocating P-type ATPase [Rhabdochlamydiaceae bacterium]